MEATMWGENSKADDTEALFRQVVVLDLYRILSRLRSRHGETWKTTGRLGLITQLHEAINDKSVKARSGLTKSSLKAGRDRARALHVLFTKLEGMSDLHAETVEAHEVNVQVEPFQIQMPTSLQESPWKVHAGIQLLFFYELHPRYPRPRFICSSKSACYLCNLFFFLPGGFHVPRTHGRLYDKWTLPDWLDVPVERHGELSRIATRLKATLDSQVRRASKSKKKLYHFPNESVVLPLAHWPSSSLSRNLSTQASTSTVRPRPSPSASLCTEIPLTSPRTPPEPLHTGNSDTEMRVALAEAALAENTTGHISTPNDVSPITVRHKELPYGQLITLTTPSLHYFRRGWKADAALIVRLSLLG
ncbi:uncharacterized protein LY89DRAFT_673949 [Mollisia scopiformis]|uniref:Uncharacterized protein n=1 Tax=Mollisia scopiformis TaxID=149040 RepID=A0A194WW27_MOLSC|nr:uncharacterized protein LY89DRAFT_673949 [Mollisia scopiformis]KUJ12168.1 hypothetical protein LY89DRAFT_673949 [Mollisia scopiformis]